MWEMLTHRKGERREKEVYISISSRNLFPRALVLLVPSPEILHHLGLPNS
jgi:hypothetical protein